MIGEARGWEATLAEARVWEQPWAAWVGSEFPISLFGLLFKLSEGVVPTW